MGCTIEDLYKSFRESLRNLITSKVKDATLAEDLVQETFARITQYCRCGEGCNHPKAFLYKAAMNVVADHFRTTRKGTFTEPTQIDDQDNMNEEAAACLIPLIDSLPAPYREAVQLADIEQVAQQEVARRMGLSLSGAKSRVQRGRAKLRDMILALCEIEQDSYGNIIHCKARH